METRLKVIIVGVLLIVVAGFLNDRDKKFGTAETGDDNQPKEKTGRFSLSKYLPNSSSTRNKTLNTSTELTELRQQLKELKAELATVQHKIAHNSNRINLALSQIDDSSLSGELPFTEKELTAIESQEAKLEIENEILLANHVDAIESYFDSEVVKNGWAEKAETAIEQSLDIDKAPNDSIAIIDLQCKSSLCRLELEYDLAYDGQDGESTYPTSISGLLDTATTKTINNEDQKGTAIIFLGQPDADIL